MGNIEWLPIAGIPDVLKDGREVLLWLGTAEVGTWNAADTYGTDGFWEAAYDCALIEDVTHFAEINPPT